MAYHSCLSIECSYMLLNGFQIDVHAEFKNDRFVQCHHILQFITLKVFVIQTHCLQL